MTAKDFQADNAIYKSEYEMQKAIVRWCNSMNLMIQHRFFAVSNGANKNRVSAAKAKAEGQRAGVSDLIFYRDGGHTLWLELKNGPKGRVSDEQQEFNLSLRLNGHTAHICRFIEDAKQIITEFYQ